MPAHAAIRGTTSLAAGTVLAGYRVEDLIGRGGMGTVYRATQLSLDRTVALKAIPAAGVGEDFRERFLNEARAAAAIDHPNVVPVYEAGEDAGQLFLSMRLVSGETLAARIRTAGRLGAERAVAVVTQLAAALDAAHGRGLVHRDVKPANVLLEPPTASTWPTSGSRAGSTPPGSRESAAWSARSTIWRRRRCETRRSTAGRTSTRSRACSSRR